METFVSLDFFGSFLHWYVNYKKKVYTSLGGILTVFSSIICCILLAFLIKDFTSRDNPNITENDMSKIFTKIDTYTEKDLVTIGGDLKSENGYWSFYQSKTSVDEAIVEMFYDIKEND